MPVLRPACGGGGEELNETRAAVGLPPVERFHGGISRELALVATFPQLEYPRRWPTGVQVTGPMEFELPYPEIELPAGEAPLVLVAPSTAQDPELRLVRAALEALAEEPVRVVATTNRPGAGRPLEVPANAVVVDWLSYSQVMPRPRWWSATAGTGRWRGRSARGSRSSAARTSATWRRTARAWPGRARA